MPPETQPAPAGSRLKNHAQAAVAATAIVLAAGGSQPAGAAVAPRSLARRIEEVRAKVQAAVLTLSPLSPDAPETLQFPNFLNSGPYPGGAAPAPPPFANAAYPAPRKPAATPTPGRPVQPSPTPGFPNFLNSHP